MNLSEDEIKVLIGILEQLTYKLPAAKVVQEIFDKLSANIKKPELTPVDPASFDPANPNSTTLMPDVIEGEPITS